MKRNGSTDGQGLREIFAAATAWLEKSAPEIDALNVFPVPDGDTGTNMLLTMRSTVEEAYRAPDHSASAVVQAMSKGALMGARGNSGVILSQIWRGLAQGLAGKEAFTGSEFAEAFLQASKMAYKGLNNPVEGTILTVIREAAVAGKAQADSGKDDLVSVLDAIVNAANIALANTPTLLPVLKEAGVVDAGGQGLYTLLEGALRHLRGEGEQMKFRKPQMVASNVATAVRMPQMVANEVPYGYCTEFMLKGEGIEPEKLREKLKKKGESLIVVGDKSTVRVHIHTLDPGMILHYTGALGTLHQVSIRNMDEQHEDFLEMQRQKMPASDIAVVAVVPGDGLRDVFNSLGAVVVSGGQTMNPSTKDMLQAVESVVADKVILLPNNNNVVLTAGQVHNLTKKSVKVVPTVTIPQGVAALLAFDYESDFETNEKVMTKAKSGTRTIEITKAIRSTKFGELKIKKKQSLGLLDTELVAVGNNALDVLSQILKKLDMSQSEVVTIYYGNDTTQAEAEEISQHIRNLLPQLQVEIVRGGQPHYSYIISIE
jgi:uncharacterized protein